MSDTIIMPQLGETVAEGKILTWFKAVGEDVKIGDKLFEVETDKVTVEVEAIAGGRLGEIRVDAGATAKVGAVVAVLSQAKAAAVPAAIGGNTMSPASALTQPAVTTLTPFAEVKTSSGNYGKTRTPNGLAVSPLARRTLAQSGMQLEHVVAHAEAKGLRRVCEADVRAAIALGGQERAPVPSPTSLPLAAVLAGGVPLSAIRRKTASRLAENWRAIPHVFQAIEVDFTRVDNTRNANKEAFREASGASLTYLPFICRAVCMALQDFPNINAIFDGQSLSPIKDINLGIAVDLSHNGLVVPVVKSAGDLTVGGMARAIVRLTEKARTGKLTAGDMSGGTYSITNNGAFGTMFTSPIINAPQVAILSTDAIRKRPAVVSTDEGDFIAPRMMGTVGQSFDHRAFDGAYSASFLSRLKQVLETHAWSNEF